jgi:hypothetical protein
MRIQTPPLRETTREGRPRSFFFDVATPTSTGSSGSRSGISNTRSFPNVSSKTSSRQRLVGPPPKRPATAQVGRATSRSESHPHKQRPMYSTGQQRGPSREWWEAPVRVTTWDALAPSSFEFDLPEHLPSSPMCPANKKHKSGGTGVCVYHGRRKKSVMPAKEDTEDGKESERGQEKADSVIGHDPES